MCAASCLRVFSSLWRKGRSPYSDAAEMISMRPFSLVFAVRDDAKSSIVVYCQVRSGQVRAGKGL
jgi:hypothetical protein